MESVFPKRNEPCTCGSGKKFKKCCMGKSFHGPIQEKPKRKGSDGFLAAMLGMATAMNNDIYR